MSEKHCDCGCIYLEAECPNCNRQSPQDHIEELGKQNASLEAKLAEALVALQFYRSAVNLRIDCEITHAMQEAHNHAEAFIAKIKG